MLLASSDSIVMKRKHAAIKNRARRLKVKIMIAKISLRRKVSERFRKIMLDYPYIGTVIENFVEEHSVGADAWRRTGVLTFYGNTKLKSKVTYKAIQGHLEAVYGRRFAYGTVVQICVPCNKRMNFCHVILQFSQGYNQTVQKRFYIAFQS